mgnify:CR=1 FL=1
MKINFAIRTTNPFTWRDVTTIVATLERPAYPPDGSLLIVGARRFRTHQLVVDIDPTAPSDRVEDTIMCDEIMPEVRK